VANATRVRRWARVLLTAAACLPLGGCAALEGLLGKRPTARIAGVGLKDIGLEAATLLFDVEVENPYAVPLPLVNLDYALAGKAEKFLTGQAKLQGSVPAASSKVVSLPARVGYAEVLRALKDVRAGAIVPYAAELGLSVDVPTAGPLRLQLKTEGQLPVPATPEIKITEITWDKLTLDHAGGLVKLHVVNRNQFPVEMSELAYKLTLSDVEVAESTVAAPASFQADGGSGTVASPLSVSPKKLGTAVFRMLGGSGSAYRLAGAAEFGTPFGPMSLPVSKVGRTVFRR